MRELKYVLIIFFLGNTYVKGQNEKLSEIKTPSAPASVLIGNQASVISRPKSWNALEASIFSNYLNESGTLTIPDNFSLEFSPYWAQNKLKLSNSDFLVPKAGLTLLQNLSFSISSTKNYILNDSVHSNAIGFGIRTMLWQGTKSEKDRILNKYEKVLKDLASSTKIYALASNLECSDCNRNTYVEKLIKAIEDKQTEILTNKLSTLEKKRILQELKEYLLINLPNITADNLANAGNVSDALDSFLDIDATVNDIGKLKADRKGFKMEIAVASGLDFPTNKTDFSIVPVSGFWITPSYQSFQYDWIELLGVFRYYNYNLDFYKKYIPTANVFEQTIDYGLRIALKWKKYTLEFESIGREGKSLISEEMEGDITVRKTRKFSDFQYIMNFNYQISDDLILSYNFGKTFAPIVNIKGTLISLLSLNFALNTPKKEILEK
jgi:hypothetical protein